jgi:hypothetical protein
MADTLLYVSPAGNDAWSGRFMSPTVGKNDGPVATPQAAQAKARALIAAGLKEPLKIILRGGTYRLTTPLTFGPQDSGTKDCPVTWVSFSRERAILDGGRVITGWRQNGKLWETTIPEVKAGQWGFNELFVNGRRRHRARIPNDGYFHIAGAFFADRDPKTPNDPRASTAFIFNPGDLQPWADLPEAVVVVHHSWETSLHRIKTLDTKENFVEFTGPARWHFRYFGPRRRYYIENVFEGLDAPGEWHLNRATGVLSYMPMPGETIGKTEFVAPVVTELLRVQGQPDLGLPVEHLHFRDLTFRHSDYVLPPEGHSDAQADPSVSGAIVLTGARDCSLEGCELSHFGTYGIALRSGSKRCRIAQCHIYDGGAGLIRIGETGMTANAELRCDAHVIDNNYLHDYGEVYAGAVGLVVFQSSDNQITHNEIHDGYYTGISVGWNWGVTETQAHRNLISYNHVHHVLKERLSDGAAIYMLGTSPGTVIRNNLFHDVFAYESPLIGWGIYLDAHSNLITVENNLAYNTSNGSLMMHNGGFGHTIRNNIFARSANQLIWRARPVQQPSPTFERNLCVVTQGDLFLHDNEPDTTPAWDNNLYWRTDDTELLFMQDTFAEWQARGMDTHSLIADPQFVDLAKDDFRLKPTSPAITKLGFQPFDTSQCGLYGDRAWTDLPKQRRFPPTVMPAPATLRKPTTIAEDFEKTPVGQPAEDAYYSPGDVPGGSILVSEEQAASGRRALKFTDAPGLKNTWDPHMFYQPYQDRGTVRLRFKLWIGRGAEPWIEWRTSGYPYAVGPSLKVDAQDQLVANGQPLLKLPRASTGSAPVGEQWVAFEIVCKLGKDAPGTYDLKVTLPGAQPQDFPGLSCDPKFRQLAWLGFISLANQASVFYLDEVNLEVVK